MSDPFSRIFSTKAFDLSDGEEDGFEIDEDKYNDNYHDLDQTETAANNVVNSIRNANNVKKADPSQQFKRLALSNLSITISLATPSDAIALLNVRLTLPIPYDCRNVSKALYSSILLSKIKAELKVSVENPTKNMILKATVRGKGLIVGYCAWGFAGSESRSLDDKAKLRMRSPEGYDWKWLKKYIAVFSDLESKTIPSQDCILLMQVVVMTEYQSQGIGTQLVKWGLYKADAEMKPVHAVATPKGEDLLVKLGFKSIERRNMSIEALIETDGTDKRSHCAMVRQPVSIEEWQARKEGNEMRDAALENIKKWMMTKMLQEEKSEEDRNSSWEGVDSTISSAPSLMRTGHVKKVKVGLGEFGLERR